MTDSQHRASRISTVSPAPPASSETAQLAPHSVEVEEAALGSLLVAPQFIPVVRGFLNKEDFFIERHAWIYEAMLTLAERGDAVDERTVAEQLHNTPVSTFDQKPRLEAVGGTAYLSYLTLNTPTALHAETYARLVERTAIRRRILSFASVSAQLAYDQERDVIQILNDLTEQFRQIQQPTAHNILAVGDVTGDVYDTVVHGQDHFVPTGFVDLDAQLSGGLGRGRLHVLAGRPGMGKTTLAVSMARNIAFRQNLPVVLISYEMSKEELVEWLIAGQMKYPASDFWKMRRQQDSELVSQFAAATLWVADLPIFINDNSSTTPAQIEAYCREVAWRTGRELGCVVIDHINRAKTGLSALDYSADSYMRASLLAQEYKDLAKRLHVPVVALAQLSRAVEQRQDKHPQLSDLRESGRIEEEADRVIFLYRASYYCKDVPNPLSVELMTLKNRQGATGVVIVQMKADWSRFFNTLWTGPGRKTDGGINWKLEEHLDGVQHT